MKSDIFDMKSNIFDMKSDSDRIASATVSGQQVYSRRLPSVSPIFSGETTAILLALKLPPLMRVNI
jgi:predicted  nucleic acid-binding Zn ribbon protein